MYYLDYAKKVDDRYILNFFADSAADLKDVPINKPQRYELRHTS